MSVMNHLRELRRRVIIIALIIVAGAIAGYALYGPILHFLEKPYCSVPYQHRFPGIKGAKCTLIYTGVLDGFTTRLKTSLVAGAVLTAPLWLYQIWAFITPGLKKNERKYTIIFIGASSLLFLTGMTLAYLILAKGLRVLVSTAGAGTLAVLTANGYLSFVTLLLVVFGAAFELPLLVIMANFVGVLPSKLLRKSQRISIFLIFLFAAIATPTTDPFTMTAMAVPMCLLFEGAVVVATVHDRRKAQRVYVAPADDLVPSEIDPIPRPLDNPTWGDTT
jgi:sec-independent protein translocase protein TatC